MVNLSVLKDGSEIVHYNHPQVPLYVVKSQLSHHPNMRALCHWHEAIEYIYAATGYITYHINGEKVIVKEGDAILVNAKQMHYGFSEDGTDCTFSCILFQPQLFSSNPYLLSTYIRPITEHAALAYWYLDHTKASSNNLIKLFGLISTLYETKPLAYELLAISHLASIWAYWYQDLQTYLTSNSAAFDKDLPIQKNMVRFIYSNYTTKLTLTDIANAGNVCRSKCCQIFKKYLNQSPNDFLNAYRLEASTNLLTHTTLTITEIAYACGFHNASYYTEIFKRQKGCTPTTYRLQQQKPLTHE